MQSNIAIALFTKLKLLYEKENKFLAFPPGAVSFKTNDFSFLNMETNTGTALNESLAKAANFAKSFNFIADTSTKLSYDDRNLWDIYESILVNKQLASGQRTPEDEKKIEELRAYLLNPEITREDGTKISRQDNHDVYQSIYWELQTDYNIQKFTADNSSDPKDKQLWLLQEPSLKAKVDKAMNDWILKGLMNEVKAKNDELKYLSIKGPFTTWDEYQDEFDKSRFTKTELEGLVDFDFYSTSFYPADFYSVNSTSWNKFVLNKNEIESLCGNAPEELKLLISDVQFKSLSVETAWVDIRRPWFHNEIFNDRNWKLPKGELPLSDGGNPASGRVPAIPIAIIFARNLKYEIVVSPDVPTPPKIKTVINTSILKNFANIQINKSTNLSVKPQSKTIVQPRGTVLKTVGARVVDHRVNEPVVMKATNLQRFQLKKAPPVLTNKVVLNKSALSSKLKFFDKSMVNKEVKKTGVPPAVPDSEFEILAFVCQKVPLCPNPDPSLNWS